MDFGLLFFKVGRGKEKKSELGLKFWKIESKQDSLDSDYTTTAWNQFACFAVMNNLGVT